MTVKQSFSSKCEDIVTIVCGKSKIKLARQYYILENPDGSRQLLYDLAANDVVSYVKDQALVTDILSMAANVKQFTGLNYSQAVMASNHIKSRLVPLKNKPNLLRFKSEKGLCFHRIPFDETWDDEKCPLFLELMSRTTNSLALRCFIGSIFSPISDKSQWCWLYGNGLNGKGSLVRLLQKILNGCYASEEVPNKGNRFWTSGLLGKRLVAFSDCDSIEFPSSGFFRSLTGEDFIRIEEKGKTPFSAMLDAKFIFLSNDKPMLDNNKADTRRAIFCEIGPIDSRTSNYEKLLWEEAPYIVGHCLVAYAEHVYAAGVGLIPTAPGSTDDVTSVKWDSLQSIFDDHFIYCYDPNVAPKYQPYVTGPELQSVLTKCAMIKNMAERSRFLSFLEQRYSLKSQVFKGPNSRTIRGYVGIKARNITFTRDGQNINNIMKLNP